MILAAGRGVRMRPLTDALPKPLLEAGGKPLLAWHLEKLSRAGFREVVINHAHLGHLIEAAVGDGSRYGLAIRHSHEAVALETAGGIANALALLGDEPFLVVNADIWCDYDFACARDALRADDLARLVLVDNPEQHPEGDFALVGDRVAETGQPMLTFSGIGVYRPELFNGVSPGSSAPLAPLLRAAMRGNKVGGEHFHGRWRDIGTPQRLDALRAELTQR